MQMQDVMRTTFAARQFTDESVPDEAIHRILDHARFAPSGGNRQPWRVIVTRSQGVRDALRPIMIPVMQRYLAQVRSGESPFNTINPSAVTDAMVAATEVPDALMDGLIGAPVLLFVFVDLADVATFDRGLDRVAVIPGASIYPFVWNILLAARDAGYGGTITTFAGAGEREVQTLLGVPEHWAFAAMLPLGRPVKQLTRLRRAPVESFARIDCWDGQVLGNDGSGAGD